jgi:amino acid transporter
MSEAAPPRRRLRIRAGPLGWFLAWAVVFADIGTSVYYTPGILSGHFGGRSAIFVAMTLVVFVLLTVKYAEIAWRYPEGGGVVNVAARALHPFAGLLGGCFIMVDYYLTAALSALSGLFYLAVILPVLRPIRVAVPATIAALLVLALLNGLGIKESAKASAAVAVVAGAGQIVVVGATAVFLGPLGVLHSFQALGRGPTLTPAFAITGYAAAFLAFSGLETIAQLAPSMREPRRRVARQAMGFVVLTMTVTSPLLTLWSTTLLGGGADPNQYISLLGAHVSGAALGDYVAATASLLLIFASNTAIIGAYHVFIALARMGFLPRRIDARNRWRRTPHWAILLAVVVPVALVAATQGSADILGDLYAFGLLGAFILTCLSLDIVRWHDHERRRTPAGYVGYVVGVLTTVLVGVAWVVNLFTKPLAAEFGGGITILGLIIGLVTYTYLSGRQPVVFPFLHRPGVPTVPIAMARRMPAAEVLALLPGDVEGIQAVVKAATEMAGGRSLVFLYRSARSAPTDRAELLEVVDPYLRDRTAQAAFAQAERMARKTVRNRRYVYVPGNLPDEAVAEVWKAIHPKETVVLEGGQQVLPPVALDRVRRTYVDGLCVLRMVTGRPLQAPARI